MVERAPRGRPYLARGRRSELKPTTDAQSLYKEADATLDDLREAVTTLEEIERNAWRLLGGAHPLRLAIEDDLKDARADLSARESL